MRSKSEILDRIIAERRQEETSAAEAYSALHKDLETKGVYRRLQGLATGGVFWFGISQSLPEATTRALQYFNIANLRPITGLASTVLGVVSIPAILIKYKQWDDHCKKLIEEGQSGIPSLFKFTLEQMKSSAENIPERETGISPTNRPEQKSLSEVFAEISQRHEPRGVNTIDLLRLRQTEPSPPSLSREPLGRP